MTCSWQNYRFLISQFRAVRLWPSFLVSVRVPRQSRIMQFNFAFMWPTLDRMIWHLKGHPSQHHSHPLRFIVDSATGGCFIDQDTVEQSNISTVDLPEPVIFSAYDRRLSAKLVHQTIPHSLIISKNHREEISYLLSHHRHLLPSLGHPG